jgi:hypothetical protein
MVVDCTRCTFCTNGYSDQRSVGILSSAHAGVASPAMHSTTATKTRLRLT